MAAADLVVDAGLADACLVAVTLDEGGQRETLRPAGATGYEPGWLDAAPSRPLPAEPAEEPRARLDASEDPWLEPLIPLAGPRPWVATMPVARGEEVLGLLLLVSRSASRLGDRLLLRTLAVQLAGALDFARLYQSAFDRANALEAQDARRREFLYAVAHELRSPLTSIQTFAELLESEGGAAGANSDLLVGSLSKGVDRLAAFVNDLLDLGRVEETTVQLKLEPIDVARVLRDTETILRPSFMAREQAISIELPDEPLLAMADQRALEQILMNLLSNANRFTPDRGAITVRGRRSGAHVRVEVQDSGPGIAAADREAIFQAFYRVQRPGAPEVPGSGLGLAVAHRLTELQDGDIWVDDSAAAGSCFCLELPAAQDEKGDAS
jgi:signal transduction histidine kinase